MNSDRMGNFGFSTLHKAVLRLDHYKLEEEIESHRSEIDGVDRDGYTALKWAVARGDSQAVNLLLKAGANANSQDNVKESVLHQAAKASDLRIMQNLFEAGADLHRYDSDGRSILHKVRGIDARKVIEYLVKAGAHVNVQDKLGISPLQVQVACCDVEATKAFLGLGADIDHLDYDGDSALLGSMLRSADDITELLLSRGAKYTVWASHGCSVLHLTALYGGLRTIDILRAARLHDIDPDAVSGQGQTVLQIAQVRTCKPEGFVEKLQELLMDIRVRNTNLQGQPSINPGDNVNVAANARRPGLGYAVRNVGRLRFRYIMLRLVRISLLFALSYLGSRHVYVALGLDRVVQSLARAWRMMSPDDFLEP